LSFYSCSMITKQCKVDSHTSNMKLIPPHPSGGITKKSSGSEVKGEGEMKQKNELASPPAESQPPGNGALGGRGWQYYLAPTTTLATTLVPRWSKRKAKCSHVTKATLPPTRQPRYYLLPRSQVPF
jgi:hypothetical protein